MIILTLGEVIKKYRVEHDNMSMGEFARISGLSKPYISMLENNKNSSNGKPIVPSIPTFNKISTAIGIPFDDLMRMMGDEQELSLVDERPPAAPTSRNGIRIPVLGRVVAGIPIEAITDILDWEEIDPELAKTGEFFALQVQGASMEPKLYDGDVVIVRRQPTVESGETAIILVNGNDATVKQVKEVDAGIMLIGHNTAVYEPHFYSQQEITDLPVEILGKVVELRRKF